MPKEKERISKKNLGDFRGGTMRQQLFKSSNKSLRIKKATSFSWTASNEQYSKILRNRRSVSVDYNEFGVIKSVIPFTIRIVKLINNY